MTTLIRVIPKTNLRSFLDRHRGKGLILSALNLFMLGHLRKYPHFPREAVFWPDGLCGVLFGRIKGHRLSKTRGKVLTRLLLDYWGGTKVAVLGSLSDAALGVLNAAGLEVAQHYSLLSLDVTDGASMDVALDCEAVMITLPSPKQELLAVHLAKIYPDMHFYCVGGALNMLANPRMDCPDWIQKVGLEFVFRLRSDTRRRFIRLLGSAYYALRNVGYLARCRLVVIGETKIDW